MIDYNYFAKYENELNQYGGIVEQAFGNIQFFATNCIRQIFAGKIEMNYITYNFTELYHNHQEKITEVYREGTPEVKQGIICIQKLGILYEYCSVAIGVFNSLTDYINEKENSGGWNGDIDVQIWINCAKEVFRVVRLHEFVFRVLKDINYQSRDHNMQAVLVELLAQYEVEYLNTFYADIKFLQDQLFSSFSHNNGQLNLN